MNWSLSFPDQLKGEKKVILCDQKIKTKRLSEVERRQEFLSWSHLNEIINVTKKKSKLCQKHFTINTTELLLLNFSL